MVENSLEEAAEETAEKAAEEAGDLGQGSQQELRPQVPTSRWKDPTPPR